MFTKRSHHGRIYLNKPAAKSVEGLGRSSKNEVFDEFAKFF